MSRRDASAALRRLSRFVLAFSAAAAVCFITAVAPHGKLVAEDAETAAVQGNAAYRDADFRTAAAQYLKAIEDGLDTGHLHYNLANAYYRLGEYGYAIAHYREALKELPHDADVLANLSLARAKTVDKIDDTTGISAQLSRIFSIRSFFTDYQLEIGFLILYGIFWLLFVLEPLELFSSPKTFTGVSLVLLVVWSILAFGARPDRLGRAVLAFPPSALTGQQAHPAAVLPAEVKVYSGNSEQFQVVFVLHMGAEIESGARRGDWVEIRLPGNRRGWVKRDDVYILN